MDWHPIQQGVEILRGASYYTETGDKIWSNGLARFQTLPLPYLNARRCSRYRRDKEGGKIEKLLI